MDVDQSVPLSPVVSICVLVLDRVDLALDCLDALRDTTSNRAGVEVIVLANGTPPAALAPLAARHDIVLVRSGTNLGFGGGNNAAAAVASGRYLMFLNDDSTVEAGCVDTLLEAAEGDPTIGAVGCRILSGDGGLQEAGSVLWSDGSTARVGFGLPAGTREFADRRDVDFASANGLLVRREAWEAVGGFDEGYHPAYYEDVDLCMALRSHGYRVVYEPEARLRHLESQSTSKRYRMFLMRRNRVHFASKWNDELRDHEVRPRRDRDAAVRRALGRAEARARRRAGLPEPARRMPLPEHSGGAGDGPAYASSQVRSIAATGQLERELRQAKAEVRVKDEYIEFLEADLDERSAYLESLPSVRLKTWLIESPLGRRLEGWLTLLPPSAAPKRWLRRLLRGSLWPEGTAGRPPEGTAGRPPEGTAGA